MGDAYGAAIIEHLSRAELAKLPVQSEEDPDSLAEFDYQQAHKGNGTVTVEGTRL